MASGIPMMCTARRRRCLSSRLGVRRSAVVTFHAAAPAARVVLGQEPAHEIFRDLDAGDVDLTITSLRPQSGAG
jgi:hypothetical protein